MKLFLIILLLIIGVLALLILVVVLSPNGHILLPVSHTEKFTHVQMDLFPSMLKVDGNRLVNAEGETVVLKGLMIPDPARLYRENRFKQELMAKVQETGANAVRIPVHPDYWRNDKDYLWRYLDKMVGWAGEQGMYVLIDWHSIGNVNTGDAPLMPDLYCHTYEMTVDFWQKTAKHFKDTPNVLFEIFNEPQGIKAEAWANAADKLIKEIRDQGAPQVVIVGGIDYSKDLSWVMERPVQDGNATYVSHIYPSHSQSQWDDWFGEVSRQYPVLITEWGFMDENRTIEDQYLAGSKESYGAPLMEYLKVHGIGWVACWYDDEWKPAIFSSYEKEFTKYGEFVMELLRENK